MVELAKNNNEISLAGAQNLVASVKEGLALINKGYLAIAPDVAKLYECKAYKALGYKNFDDMCKLEFGMSHGTTVGIRKVFDKFGVITKDNKYMIPEKYADYGYTKLLLMTDKKFAEAGINPIETFTPDMTIAEMQDALKAKLEEKAEKQDNSAIESTAKIKEDVAEAISADIDDDVDDESGNISAIFDFPYIDRSNNAYDIVQSLKEEAEQRGMKPEKLALYDAILANIKEAEKEYKKIAK